MRVSNSGLQHMGLLLGEALRRFDARVLTLMASNVEVPLALANLARRQQVSTAHIHITRHLGEQGARLTALAHSAGMSKQAMAVVVNQCAAWGLVVRTADPLDARARCVQFTSLGLAWRKAFQDAVAQAQDELTHEIGADVAAVIQIGLEAYARP